MIANFLPDDIKKHIESRNLPPTMAVSLTTTAGRVAHTLKYAKAEYEDLSLRVYIEGKGCDGFYYGVSFDSPTANDFIFQSQNIDIIVDPDSLFFLCGSTIEWVDDERGRGFLVENPNHKRYRGKFYKKKSWTQAFLEKNPTNSEPSSQPTDRSNEI